MQWRGRALVLLLALLLVGACTSSSDDGTTTPTTSGDGVPDASAGAGASALSLAYPVAERELPTTILPSIAEGVNGGVVVLSDDGGTLAFASNGAGYSGSALTIGGPVYGQVQELLSPTLTAPESGSTYSPEAVSANGRFVLFYSLASDVVEGDTNERGDLFRHDRLTGDTIRVSLDANGNEFPDGVQPQADLSGDGKVVVFDSAWRDDSQPTPYEPGCRGHGVALARNIETGETTCVSVDGSGAPADQLGVGTLIVDGLVTNYDGRLVAYATNAPLGLGDGNGGTLDVYVIDRTTGLVQRATEAFGGGDADGPASEPRISADGRYVAFVSEATNLVEGDTNGVADIFVFDRLTGVTERMSVGSDGAEANGASTRSLDVSYDGRFVVFGTEATNLADLECQLVLVDRALGTRDCIDVGQDGEPAEGFVNTPTVNADGTMVAFVATDSSLGGYDDSAFSHVYVRLREPRPVDTWPPVPDEVVPVVAPTTVDIASVDGTGEWGSANSGGASVSRNGRWVAFWTDAPNISGDATEGMRHIVLRDLESGTSTVLTAGANGPSNRSYSGRIAMSDSGSVIAFHSEATNLVPNDTNGSDDVFVFRRGSGTLERVSLTYDGTELQRDARAPWLSADGSVLLYGGTSSAFGGIVPGVKWCSLVVRDLSTNANECVSTMSDGSRARIDAWALSGDGNTVVVRSSDALDPADGNDTSDLFAFDRSSGTWELVTVASDGAASDADPSYDFSVSADGSIVLFSSQATTLVPDDTNDVADFFVRDRTAGTTVRVSLEPDGSQRPRSDSGPGAVAPGGARVIIPHRLPAEGGGYDCGLAMVRRSSGELSCLSSGATGVTWQGREPSFGGGEWAVFTSTSPVVATSERSSVSQVFVRSLAGGGVMVPEIASIPEAPVAEMLVPGLDGESTSSEDIPDLIEPNAEVVGFLDEVLGEIEMPSAASDRAEFELVLGPPDAFTVQYELGDDGSTLVRHETWSYFDMLTAYTFADGVLRSFYPIAEPGEFVVGVPYHPDDFASEATWDSVRLLLADPDEAVPVEMPEEVGFYGSAWWAPHLFLVFDETGLLQVEAVPVAGGGDA